MIVSDKFYIGYRDIDTNLKITNTAILNIFEDIAGMHAKIAGEDLKTSNTTWVLTGYKVNINKRPEFEDRVTVYTWPTGMRNITASREFEIRNDKDEVLITGLSNWAHIDLNTKKLFKVSQELIDGYDIENNKTNFNESKLKKLVEPLNYLYEKEYEVDLNWIDVNEHMNNIYYMELAQMVLPEEVRKTVDFTSFEIMYKKEIKYKDKIRCFVGKDDNSYIVTFKNEDLSEIHAIIKLIYKKEEEK